MKVVLLPQNRVKGRTKPNRFYGKVHTIPTKGVWPELWSNDPPKRVNYNIDPSNLVKMDTLEIGTVTMGRCTYGTELIGMKITLESLISDKDKEGNEYECSTTYLIDCVILEPSKE